MGILLLNIKHFSLRQLFSIHPVCCIKLGTFYNLVKDKKVIMGKYSL